MKLIVDETGKYIFLSDIDNNVRWTKINFRIYTYISSIIFQLLFVMEIAIDVNSPKSNMKIVSVTEILLQTPMLNMIIVNAKVDNNEVNYLEQRTTCGMLKYTCIICNLYFITRLIIVLLFR